MGAPCTMPFGAVALGFALTQGTATALSVFLALGIGFALPFLVLGLVPGALRFVPRPGPWMLRFKQLLAFPMYAAAVWLAWVLVVQAGPNSLVLLLGAAVTLALAAWLWSITRDLSSRGRLLGAVAALLLLLGARCGRGAVEDGGGRAKAPPSADCRRMSPIPLRLPAELRGQGRAVFVDATAAWCISCLVNEETSLKREAVRAAFAERKIAYLVADWTQPQSGRHGASDGPWAAPARRSISIMRKMRAAPEVLPQILTRIHRAGSDRAR